MEAARRSRLPSRSLSFFCLVSSLPVLLQGAARNAAPSFFPSSIRPHHLAVAGAPGLGERDEGLGDGLGRGQGSAYYGKYFDDIGRLNLQGEIAISVGVVALFFLLMPAVTTLPMMPKAIGGIRWKRNQRAGQPSLS